MLTVRVLSNNRIDENTDRIFKREVQALKRQNWVSGVVMCYGSFEEEYREMKGRSKVHRKMRCLALELMEFSLDDVFKYWRSEGNKIIGSKQHFRAAQYVGISLAQTLRGLRTSMEHEHNGGVWHVHRDLKPTNVLFDIQKQVRLIDFGFSKELQWGQASVQHTTAMRVCERCRIRDCFFLVVNLVSLAP